MEKIKTKYLQYIFSKTNNIVLLCGVVSILTSCVVMDKIQARFPPKNAPSHTVSVLDNYKHGEILYCKIGTGSMNINRQWLDIKNKDFLVIKNGRSNVNLIAQYNNSKSTSMQAIFDHKGQKVTLCPLTPVYSNHKVECLNLYFLDDDLDIGIKRSVNISNFIRGSAITCAYDKNNFKQLPPPK